MATIEQAAYISTKEAANDLGMCTVFIREEIKRGNLPALKISPRRYRIDREDWEKYKSSKRAI